MPVENPTEPIQKSNSSNHSDNPLANHLLNTLLPSVNNSDRFSPLASSIVSPWKTDPTIIPFRDASTNPYALEADDSTNRLAPATNLGPDLRLPLSAASTRKPTGSDNPEIPADIATAFDEYFGLSALRGSESKSSINKAWFQQNDKPSLQVPPSEFSPSEFVLEYRNHTTLTDERDFNSNNVLRSLFGVVQSISPF